MMDTNKVTGILIVGVGGQGTLLASRILGRAALLSGCDVRISEVHGMSQQGGSVVTYVKYGKEVLSPMIGRGEADVILGFELLEACRALPYLKADAGKVIVNTQKIMPMLVITGEAAYPEDLLTRLQAHADVLAFDALSAARDAGNMKSVNTVLLGAFSMQTAFDEKIWISALNDTVPPKYAELNRRAFTIGRALAGGGTSDEEG